MKNPFKLLDEKLQEKYWYSERVYQYVKCGIYGWGLSFILLVIWLIKFV